MLCEEDPKPQRSPVGTLWVSWSVEDKEGAGKRPGRMEEVWEKKLGQNGHIRLIPHRPARKTDKARLKTALSSDTPLR